MKIQYVGEPVEVPDVIGNEILQNQEKDRIENVRRVYTHYVRLDEWSYDVKFQLNVEEVK